MSDLLHGVFPTIEDAIEARADELLEEFQSEVRRATHRAYGGSFHDAVPLFVIEKITAALAPMRAQFVGRLREQVRQKAIKDLLDGIA